MGWSTIKLLKNFVLTIRMMIYKTGFTDNLKTKDNKLQRTHFTTALCRKNVYYAKL